VKGQVVPTVSRRQENRNWIAKQIIYGSGRGLECGKYLNNIDFLLLCWRFPADFAGVL
jgi:hypothetical protein